MPNSGGTAPSGRSSNKKPWLVIVGPTAVGKSKVAERLARTIQTEIITADSRQVYQRLNIGTGKIDTSFGVVRHLIDFVPPERRFSAGAYKKAAESIIGDMEKKEKTVLIEGGSGLYLKAILYGLWEGPPADWAFREQLLEKEKTEGEGTLYRLLEKTDPVISKKIYFRELPKIVRALEVYHLTRLPLSKVHAAHRALAFDRQPTIIMGLRRDRSDLYRRINSRVDRMIRSGLIEEVAGLLESGLSPELSSMRALGYRQMIPYIQGTQSLEDAVSLLKRDTRRFAKRQMTWFRSNPEIEWIDLHPEEEANETAERIMRLKKSNIML